VDDELETQELIAAALRLDGFAIQPVGDARAALLAVREERYDVILLDLGLPGIDGLELLRMIKRDTALQHVPVIVLTGWEGADYQSRSFDSGAHDYINKPFNVEALRARVRAAHRMKRLYDKVVVENLHLETARASAEESARVKSEFVAGISHELRTPMNGVIAMTDLLGRTALDPTQAEYVETIRSSGEWLLAIINDVLNFSRIQSGKLELNKAPFMVRNTVEAALDLVAAKCAEKQIVLGYEITSGIGDELVGDEMRVRQVLINFLSNAVKFTASGEVIVTVSHDDRAKRRGTGPAFAQFSVRDTGVGIAPDRLHRLFHSFVQADPSVQAEFGGTGLGLAISRGLVELMGGRVWAESTPGKGSLFHFNLPVEPGHSSAESSIFCHELSGKRLLVLHHSAALCGIIERAAETWGMQAVIASHLDVVNASGTFHLVVAEPALVSRVVLQQTAATRDAAWLALLPFAAGAAEAVGADATFSLPFKPGLFQEAAITALTRTSQVVPAYAGSTSGGTPAPVQCTPLRILVTDDNVINQKVAARLLQQLGHNPDIADDGYQALEAIQTAHYDLVLMDVQMPGMDGLETTRRIRQAEASNGRHTFIVALTANAMPGDREKCLAAGMDDYLAKPVRAEAMQSVLSRAVPSAHVVPATGSAPVSLPPRDPSPVMPSPLPSLPTVAADPHEPLVDMDRLNEFSGGSPTSLIEITDLYLTQTTEQLDRLDAALRNNDAAAVMRLAHSSAGASGVCGILAMEPAFRRLEQMGREGRLDGAFALLESLRVNFGLVREFLLNTRQNLSAA
jgi:signal transduction histidine kinase/HPt (histidine-containing phosphotransfer) domain-containing protein/BarA-like signal transduction histidine kinase